MSQRKALIASIAITLILSLSAIGIRAEMLDSDDGTQSTAVTAETGLGQDILSRVYEDDDDDRDDDDEHDQVKGSSWEDDDHEDSDNDDHDDHDDVDHDDEDDHDDD